MEVSELKDKKILIVGLARTGVALAHFLTKHGANVTVSDHKSKAELVNSLEKMADIEVTYELGGHSPKTFLQQDIIVLSPGISPVLKIFDYARQNGVKVTGEFEFCSQFVKQPIVAITGTNGKSTVIHLAEMFLKESGVKTWLGGNYGEPMSEYLLGPQEADVVLCEVSSFMLEHVETFNPKNVVFTNLAENHLDRYYTVSQTNDPEELVSNNCTNYRCRNYPNW